MSRTLVIPDDTPAWFSMWHRQPIAWTHATMAKVIEYASATHNVFAVVGTADQVPRWIQKDDSVPGKIRLSNACRPGKSTNALADGVFNSDPRYFTEAFSFEMLPDVPVFFDVNTGINNFRYLGQHYEAYLTTDPRGCRLWIREIAGGDFAPFLLTDDESVILFRGMVASFMAGAQVMSKKRMVTGDRAPFTQLAS